MPREEDPATPVDFAGRLMLAINAKKTTRSRTEREAGLKRGRIQPLLGIGPRPIRAPEPETIRQLADYLEVSYEWLAIGRGPMRVEGWAPSPLEEAMLFASRPGTRRDAIDDAVERHREDTDMTAIDWILAFDASARRLERAGVPRPEVVLKHQQTVTRLSTKRARLLKELAELEAREVREAEQAPPKPRRPTAKR